MQQPVLKKLSQLGILLRAEDCLSNPNGTILVASSSQGVRRIDPLTGVSTYFPIGRVPHDIVVTSLGDIFVTDNFDGVSRINPITGERTPLATNRLYRPELITADLSGNLLVTDDLKGLVRINLATGIQEIVSSHRFSLPTGLAVQRDGSILIASQNEGGLIRIDPDSGHRSILSAGSPGNWFSPRDVLVIGVVPEPMSGALFVLCLLGATRFRWRNSMPLTEARTRIRKRLCEAGSEDATA